jgi:hypothetical protein
MPQKWRSTRDQGLAGLTCQMGRPASSLAQPSSLACFLVGAKLSPSPARASAELRKGQFFSTDDNSHLCPYGHLLDSDTDFHSPRILPGISQSEFQSDPEKGTVCTLLRVLVSSWSLLSSSQGVHTTWVPSGNSPKASPDHWH